MKTYSSEAAEVIQILEDIRESYPQFFEVGADYNRALKTDWSDSMFCAKKGDLICARHFMQQVLERLDHITARRQDDPIST